MFIEYLKVFAVGGALCAIGQLLIDKTKLTPARILTVYVVAGLILEAVGLYSPLVKWASAGATVPLTGFGSTLASGVEKAVSESGVLGAFTGGFTATAAEIGAVLFFGRILALLLKSRERKEKTPVGRFFINLRLNLRHRIRFLRSTLAHRYLSTTVCHRKYSTRLLS